MFLQRLFSSWLPISLWALNAILAILAYLVTNPVYVSICAKDKCRSGQDYEKRELLEALLGYAGDTLTASTFWNALATVIIACFTFALMRSTKQNAVATKEAVEVADRNSRNELRPWLSIDFKTVEDFTTTTPVVIHLQAFNHGQTPAKEVIYRCGIGLLPARLPPGFQFPPTTYALMDRATVFPQGSNNPWFVAAIPFPILAIRELVTLRNRLYIWGEAEYFDIYDKPHVTKFAGSAGGPAFVICMQAHAWGIKNADRFRFTWQYASKHNEAT